MRRASSRASWETERRVGGGVVLVNEDVEVV